MVHVKLILGKESSMKKLFILLALLTSVVSFAANDAITVQVEVSEEYLAQGYYAKDIAKVRYAASEDRALCRNLIPAIDESGVPHLLKMPKAKKTKIKIKANGNGVYNINIPLEHKKSRCKFKFYQAEISICNDRLDVCDVHKITSTESFDSYASEDGEEYFSDYKECREDGIASYVENIDMHFLFFDYKKEDKLCSEAFIQHDYGFEQFYNACPGKATILRVAPSPLHFSGKYEGKLFDGENFVSNALVTFDNGINVESSALTFSTNIIMKDKIEMKDRHFKAPFRT